MPTKKKLAIEFETEIVDFLRQIGFEHVDGAKDSFKINGVQIDACGAFEDTLLIIECFMSMEQKPKPQSLKRKIESFRGRTYPLEKGLRAHSF